MVLETSSCPPTVLLQGSMTDCCCCCSDAVELTVAVSAELGLAMLVVTVVLLGLLTKLADVLETSPVSPPTSLQQRNTHSFTKSKWTAITTKYRHTKNSIVIGYGS